MDKFFVDKGGEVEEYSEDAERRKHVRFPVCLAVKYGDSVSEVCPDFVLNISKAGVFIKTDSPLPKGSTVVMHFYIPPEDKLLGEFKGRVVEVNQNNPAYQRGMHIKFIHYTKEEMQSLEDYLEGKKRLIDKKT